MAFKAKTDLMVAYVKYCLDKYKKFNGSDDALSGYKGEIYMEGKKPRLFLLLIILLY
jgi:hypothetical protein